MKKIPIEQTPEAKLEKELIEKLFRNGLLTIDKLLKANILSFEHLQALTDSLMDGDSIPGMLFREGILTLDRLHKEDLCSIEEEKLEDFSNEEVELLRSHGLVTKKENSASRLPEVSPAEEKALLLKLRDKELLPADFCEAATGLIENGDLRLRGLTERGYFLGEDELIDANFSPPEIEILRTFKVVAIETTRWRELKPEEKLRKIRRQVWEDVKAKKRHSWGNAMPVPKKGEPN